KRIRLARHLAPGLALFGRQNVIDMITVLRPEFVILPVHIVAIRRRRTVNPIETFVILIVEVREGFPLLLGQIELLSNSRIAESFRALVLQIKLVVTVKLVPLEGALSGLVHGLVKRLPVLAHILGPLLGRNILKT